jgi:hypothetical protein
MVAQQNSKIDMFIQEFRASQATLAESMEVLLGMVTPHTRVQNEIQIHQRL